MATRKKKVAPKRVDRKQAYIDKMIRERGFVLDYHKVLVKHDFEAMQRINEFLEGIYLKRRRLDLRTRELICVVALILRRANPGQVKSHMRLALDRGVTRAELLEAVELVIPLGGFIEFQAGLSAWCEVTGAKGIEPTVKGYEQ